MTNKKKMALAAALVLVMVVSAIGGTLAYLTDSSHLDNVFLVGAFTQPTDPKPNPDPPGPGPDPDPEPDDPTDFGAPNGFIFEPYWNLNGKESYVSGGNTIVGDHHRLLAGDATTKDPYIGIGKGSEDGYVLACITNPMADSVYFTLCDGWAPVAGHVTEVTINDANGKPTNVTDGTKFYSQGLFKWVGTGKSASSDPLAALQASATEDVWTDNPVFTYVYTAKDGLTSVQELAADSRKMTVWAYIGQSNGQQDDGTTAITAQYVEDQAKAWATNASDATKYPGITANP